MCTTYNAYVDASWFPSKEDIPESFQDQQYNANLRNADEQTDIAIRTVLAQYIREHKGCY